MRDRRKGADMKDLIGKSKCLGGALFLGVGVGWPAMVIPYLLGFSDEALERCLWFGVGFATGYFYLKLEQMPEKEDVEGEMP